MSKIIIEIETREDALQAKLVIDALLNTGITVETAVEKFKEVAETRKVVKKTKPADEPKDDTIDLKSLTQTAKDAVGRTDRVTAKDVISKYGDKLSAVDESDYAALSKELEALGV